MISELCATSAVRGLKKKYRLTSTLNTHNNDVLVKQLGALEHFEGEAITITKYMIRASIKAAPEAERGNGRGPVPADVADDSNIVEEEELQENGSDRFDVNFDNMNEININESDGGDGRA